MDSNIDFSECLNNLMHVVGLKSSKLAKAINVDASLIYKWLNNKAIPPYNSRHIDLIADQIVKSIVNSYHLKKIEDLIKKNIAGCLEINEKNMLDYLKKLLIESQGYSIEKKKTVKKNSVNKNKELTDIKAYMGNSLDAFQCRDITGKNIISRMEIITGNQEVLNAALELLETASTANMIPAEPIMLTLFSEMGKLPFLPEFKIKWKNSLYKVVKRGWDITYQIRINNNNYRNLKIIEDMLIPISTGRYQVFYTNSNDYNRPFEIVLVPNAGVLLCLSSTDRHQVDSAILMRNEVAQEIFKGYFYQLLASSKPLLKFCIPVKSIGFQRKYSETEEIPGNKYSLRWGLSPMTIPVCLYEKYLERSNISKEEIVNKISYHKRIIKAFESQVNHYKVYDIISEESIINIIKRRRYDFLDKYYAFNDTILTNDDIIRHLSYTIFILKNYDNYEIGLAGKDQIESLPITNWMVKENSLVVIVTCDQENTDPFEKGEEDKTAKGFMISESNITKAFEYYFENLWHQIEPAKKNKKELICILENYIKLLSDN